MALSAAANAFRLTLHNPGEVTRTTEQSARMAQYALGWRIYNNDVFSRLSSTGWGGYADSEGLYAKTRGFYNPGARIVDFYVGAIYQGVLSDDGARLPDGEMLAVPMSRDTPPEIRQAVAQTWQWSNWQEEKDTWILFGASMGDAPMLIVDDVQSGRVYQQPMAPSMVKDVDFNRRGDVTYADIQYSYYDRETKQNRNYRCVMDKERISVWADMSGAAVEDDNPYGFVPMVWARHRQTGTQFGAPAIRGWDKIERLNSVASLMDANIRIHAQSPTFISSEGDAKNLTVDGKSSSENDLKIVQIKGAFTMHTLPNNLSLADAEKRIESLMFEIERDHPETTMYEKLAAMSTLTGPAAEKVLGNVKGYVQGARARYDNQYIKAAQMQLAIGGFRYREGLEGWAAKTNAQKLFAPFDLQSYERGDLNFSIDFRPLIPQTNAEVEAARTMRFQRIKAGIDATFPVEYQLQQDGVTEEELKAYQDAVLKSDFGDGFPMATADNAAA